ncbi:MAG: hypothetical protein EZS28_009209 [Streblomastix strix]|uniref:Uncharacterized protein n=1 Tax=Streblomastix strix TaxID=222440 RepID=A0A5J4WJJ9_9EUKA|nr:MAG: hypothetical protein EZS28_009209 [Streblomastix strix]
MPSCNIDKQVGELLTMSTAGGIEVVNKQDILSLLLKINQFQLILHKGNNHLQKEIIVVHLLRRLLLRAFILRLPKGSQGLNRAKTQASSQNAQVLFTHLRDRADLNMTPSQPFVVDKDANGSDTNVFANDCEITMTDDDAGHALRKLQMQEIQYFITRFIELINWRNAFAIDFWANPIAQAQIWDYRARTLHIPEIV